jgi:hypothetical protein
MQWVLRRTFQPERNNIKIGQKILRKRSFGRYKHIWKDNIQTGLKNMGCENEDRIPLAKDKVQ